MRKAAHEKKLESETASTSAKTPSTIKIPAILLFNSAKFGESPLLGDEFFKINRRFFMHDFFEISLSSCLDFVFFAFVFVFVCFDDQMHFQVSASGPVHIPKLWFIVLLLVD